MESSPKMEWTIESLSVCKWSICILSVNFGENKSSCKLTNNNELNIFDNEWNGVVQSIKYTSPCHDNGQSRHRDKTKRDFWF